MTKSVIIDEEEGICSTVTGPTGPEHRHQANSVIEQAIRDAHLSLDQIGYCVATGYGRMNVPFADSQITELTCHARGVAKLFPNARTAIDIGGQDAKGLKIQDGRLKDFVMNDKCAAGTGRFLEVLSETLGLNVKDLGDISLKSKKKIRISSICTIFAEQEIRAQISEGAAIEDIIAGLHESIAGRVVRMIKRLKIEPDVVITGGVAKNSGVIKALREHIGYEIFVPENPLLSGAFGAALLGREIYNKETSEKRDIRRGISLKEGVTFFK